MSKTTDQHFGIGVDTSIFTPKILNSKGELRACLGSHNKAPNRKWYGITNPENGMRINPYDISFCEFCGNNGFKSNEIFEITDQEYPFIIPKLSCDSPITEKYKSIIGDKRCVYMNGIKFNVNITDESDKIWSPILKIPTEQGINAASKGVLLAALPSMSYWEFVVKADEDGSYYNDKYYYKVKGKFEDGRDITVMDQKGNTNYYTPMKGGMVSVNSYKSGYGNRFFFQAPSKLEIDESIEPIHNNSSNKLFLEVTIYEKQEIYQSRGGGVMRGGDGGKWRGSNGGVTRGGGGYAGGSNFGTSGYSEGVITKNVNANFIKINSINCIIQLVNNEDDSEREYMSRKIQDQVDRHTQMEIATMISQRNILDFKINKLQEERSTRDVIFSKKEQLNCLV